MAKTKVAVLGAAGETGSSIVDGLLEDGNFEIVALVRPSSISKPANIKLQDRGIILRSTDLLGPQDALVQVLRGIDIVVSAVGPDNIMDQIPLITAAKVAGIKRFVPCGFIVIAPPRGVLELREQKEDVLDHIKRLYVPYTYIEVGWWYQISFPRLPSGKIDYAAALPHDEIPGDGKKPTALTDVASIGRYVARIITDERTLNKMVFAYDVLTSPLEVYELLEKISGEQIPKNFVSKEQYEARVEHAKEMLAVNSEDFVSRMTLHSSLYQLSWGIRGDNTPDNARYLGFITSKELYPDFKVPSYEEYLQKVLKGGAKTVYDEKRAEIQKAMKQT